jgi:hypothetical protein
LKTEDWRSRAWRAAVYLLLTLAWSWPLPLHLANRFAHDPGDPLLVTYLIWWNAHAVPFTQAWWNAPMFWPMPDALALTEHLAGVSPFTTPVQWLGGSPLLAYNLLLIASTWWTLLATDALVRRLTGDRVAAACGAFAFAFAPYRTAQLAHLQLYACWWIPLALLALHAYLAEGRRRWLVVFALSWMLQALTNGYSLFHLPLLFFAWVVVLAPWRTDARRVAAIGAAWVAGTLPLLPILLHYHQVQQRLGLVRARGEMLFYSAQLRDFLSAAPTLLFWKTAPPATTEAYLFPGMTVVLLVAAAIVTRLRGRTFWFYTGAAVIAAWLCLGPSAGGSVLGVLTHPYELLLRLPGFSGIRVPARFFMIAAFCLAVAAGLSLAHLRANAPRPILVGVVAIGLAVDGLIAGMPLGVPPGEIPGIERGARLLALPYTDAEATIGALYRSMAQRLAVVNGYAGYVPPYAGVVEWALNRRDPSVLTELRRGHPLYVVVADGPEAAAWSAFMNAQNDAPMIGISSAGRVYAMPPAAYPRQLDAGAAIALASVRTEDGWIVGDLGRASLVRAVELRTRGHVPVLQRTIRVETSDDGTVWSVAADEPPGGLALLGVLAQPRVVPVRVMLPDVQARFVRVNGAPFGAAALTVYGR